MWMTQVEFQVRPEQKADFLEHWNRAGSELKSSAGFVSATLLEGDNNHYQAQVRWRDKESSLQARPGLSPQLHTYCVSNSQKSLERVDLQSPSRSPGYASEAQNAIVERLFVRESASQAKILGSLKTHGLPEIQISAFEGQILEILLRSIGARRGVEIGVLGGYSTSWIARAIGPEGELWALDKNAQALHLAQNNLAGMDRLPSVHWCPGAALETLEKLNNINNLDFVFIDADKANTPRYLQWSMPRLRPGGLVLIDNAYAWGAMLHFGQTSPPQEASKGRFDRWSRRDFEAMTESWEILARSGEFVSTVLPTGEGLAVGWKQTI
jgi:predicted O-methyltransferase YrrM